MGVDPVSFEANLDMYATYLRILSHTDILLFYGLFVLFHAWVTVLWDLKVQFCVLFQCLWIICIMQINIKKMVRAVRSGSGCFLSQIRKNDEDPTGSGSATHVFVWYE